MFVIKLELAETLASFISKIYLPQLTFYCLF